jgi:hypothetical protein
MSTFKHLFDCSDLSIRLGCPSIISDTRHFLIGMGSNLVAEQVAGAD